MLIGVYGILSAIFVGLASQDLYTAIREALQETSGDIFQGNVGEIQKAGLLLLTGLTGSFNRPPTEAQSIYAAFFGLLVWLTTVWLLRAILAGQRPKLRDGLYNSASPFVSTFLIFGFAVLQALPIAFAAIVLSTGLATGFIGSGVESMLISVGLLLLVILSLYWLTSTLIALVVVTLPGMYPFRALRTAGDLVMGRRLRILLRLLWMLFITAFIWVAIMVPIILFDAWIKSVWTVVEWFPIIPIALLLVSSVTVVWTASYVYLFYRKVVEDDASPA